MHTTDIVSEARHGTYAESTELAGRTELKQNTFKSIVHSDMF